MTVKEFIEFVAENKIDHNHIIKMEYFDSSNEVSMLEEVCEVELRISRKASYLVVK